MFTVSSIAHSIPDSDLSTAFVLGAIEYIKILLVWLALLAQCWHRLGVTQAKWHRSEALST
ncbi:hypothetical protein DBV15_01262 [Temnothorax longispinosus]|uniref:Uncharacterized protein n=1 Tax=Temnothorax longispinosus TaxID=300112 RepID=A0A4S2KJ86_9HYME|nr:hypothetical protein DBV15_01262 [Temnothorax longispinosus]